MSLPFAPESASAKYIIGLFIVLHMHALVVAPAIATDTGAAGLGRALLQNRKPAPRPVRQAAAVGYPIAMSDSLELRRDRAAGAVLGLLIGRCKDSSARALGGEGTLLFTLSCSHSLVHSLVHTLLFTLWHLQEMRLESGATGTTIWIS